MGKSTMLTGEQFRERFDKGEFVDLQVEGSIFLWGNRAVLQKNMLFVAPRMRKRLDEADPDTRSEVFHQLRITISD